MKKIKILIADDHKLITEGLRSLLKVKNNRYDFIIDGAESSEAAIEKVKNNNYNIIFMDYELGKKNGAETTQIIVGLKPDIPVIALSNYNETAFIKSFQKAGAKGYMLKNADSNELLKAIDTILEGGRYYSNEVVLMMMDTSKNSLKIKKLPSGKIISEREIEVLQLISKGYSSRLIANKLFLSKHAIDKCRRQLLFKMKVKNTVNLLAKARELKFID